MFAIVTAIIALVMGVIGIAIAKQADSGGMGLPGTGTVLSVLAIVIAIAWFVIISVFMKGVEDAGEKLRDENRQNAQQQKNEIAGQPGLPVTAVELHEAYDTNSIRADTKYKRQVVEVTGAVIRVNDRTFQVVVELVGDENDREKTVECEFTPESRAALAALVPDQQVTIRGRCTGKIGRRVFVADAILVK